MSTYEIWSTIISSLSLCCSSIGFMTVITSIFLLYFQNRVQIATHTVNTLNMMEERWTSDLMLRARLAYSQSWLEGKREFNPTAEYIAEFFEELGIYQKMKALSERAIWETYSWYVENYFYIFEEGIKAKQAKDPTLFKEFRNLFYKMQKINRKEGAPSIQLGAEELSAFIKREVEVTNLALALRKDSLEQGT